MWVVTVSTLGAYMITIIDRVGSRVATLVYLLSLFFFSANTYAEDSPTWDLDANGQLDALTDGLLLLRYTFGLRGASLTENVVASDSPLSAAEVELAVESAYSIADIDGDGSIDALTDGLLLLRYLFTLRDQSLIADTISPQAIRTSAVDIVSYIENYMPTQATELNDNDIDGNQGNTDSDASSSSWVPGEYSPSINYANRCANPRTGSNYQDLMGTVADENNWIRSWSNETYLWYDELPDIDPASINNPIDYFELMKTNAVTNSGQYKDRFHFAQQTQQYNQFSEYGISVSYGLSVVFVNSYPPRKALVIMTEHNSPAAANNIQRGAEIVSIDGEDIAYGDADIINQGLFPTTLGESHSFVIRDVNATSDRTITLQSAQITEAPVHTLEVIEQNNKNIGYLLLNTFNVATAEQQLIDAGNFLKFSQIDELVVDLRYNSGGYLAISAELATIIAGESALGNIYKQFVFNNKRSMENQAYQFPSVAFGLSAQEGTELPKLNLSRVYILATANTASASESLINGLRGIDVEVILIGDRTMGKPYGFLPEDNCGITYFTIQFKGANAKGFGDYADGFIPSTEDNNLDQVRGCQVDDDLSHTLGNINENMLATALYHIENNSCPVNVAGLSTKPRHPLSAIRGQVVRQYPAQLIME